MPTESKIVWFIPNTRVTQRNCFKKNYFCFVLTLRKLNRKELPLRGGRAYSGKSRMQQMSNGCGQANGETQGATAAGATANPGDQGELGRWRWRQ